MNRIFYFLAMLLLITFCSQVSAQNDRKTLSVVATAGASEAKGGIRVSYTVGQAAYAPIKGTGQAMNAGFQQVFCIPSFDTVRPVVCQGATFDKGGFTKVSSVEPGTFYETFQGVNGNGCDSIVYMELTVKPASITQIHDQAENLYAWAGRNIEESGVYNDTLSNALGCDSIVQLHLVLVHDQPLPTIYSYEDMALVCPHRTVDGKEVYYYAYKWISEATGKAVNSDPQEASYQPMDGGRLNGCYHLEVLLSEDDTNWVRSNTICFGSAGIGDVDSPFSFSMSPNPVYSGRTLNLSVDVDYALLHDATMTIYDLQGRRVYESPVHERNSIAVSFPSGVYSVHISLSDGRIETRKLIVR